MQTARATTGAGRFLNWREEVAILEALHVGKKVKLREQFSS